MKAVHIPAEAVTEVLTALHGCKSQLGDAAPAHLSKAIGLLEGAEEALIPGEQHDFQTNGIEMHDPAQYDPLRVPPYFDPNEPADVDDMPPMPPRLDGDEDDKSGGLATMAKEMLKNSALGDSGPRPARNELKGYSGADRT